nr:lysine exporter LysO family protein [uncultured Prevotella sp.]
MKGSLIVVGFFVLGLMAGRMEMVPAWLLDSRVSFVALCGLLLFVGLGIGLNPDMKREVRSLNPRLALLPIVTILGSWMGALAAWLLMHRSLADCLAVDSGFAYYSLSSIFITEYRGAELGTIALLANIIREMLTLLGAPLMAKLFGPLAPISAGGATTMDTTLPIISQTVGQRYVALTIYHGFVVDFSVPFLVTWWCMMG